MNAHSGPAFKISAISPDAVYERSSYRRSRGADPIASIAALGMGFMAIAAFAFMAPVLVKKEKREPTIVTMLELPVDPPPAPSEPPPQADMPPPPTAVVAPAPVIKLNLVPILAAPAPQPVQVAVKTAPVAVPAVVAKDPENVGDMSAQVVFRRPIRVPLASRRAHEEGVVILSVQLGVDGRVNNISIATSSGFPRLDRAALEAVRDWRWSPLIRSGTPVMVRGLVRIPFVRERGPRDRDGMDGRRRHEPDRDTPDRDRNAPFNDENAPDSRT